MGRFAGVLSVTAVAMLALASSAGAAITASQVSSPASPAFAIWNVKEPDSIEVAGTASGGSPGDKVDVDCFTGGEARVLEGGVPLAANGSFFVVAGLEKAAGHVCRLRAVPAGTTPADPTPFAGPLLAVGQRQLETTTVGAEVNRPAGFILDAPQLSAGYGYHSVGRCGVSGFLSDAALSQTTTTFVCGDRLWRFDDYDEPGSSTRSQIRIDGADAYTAASVNEIWGGVEHFPAIAFSASQDPATGDVVAHDNETFDLCPSQTYPGTTSTCFVPSGVRDERTIEQTSDGHLVTVTDRYSSVDGQAHELDLLPDNVQRFAPTGGKHAPAIAYRFPGQQAFSTHVSGDVVSFPDTTPGAVMIRVEGFPDGDQSSGQGAIVFDRPASPATFNLLENEEFSGFEFHQTATVPASGSTSFRTAYVQGYTSAEVESLVARAEAAFSPAPPAPPAPPAGQPAPAPTIKVLRAKLDKHHGTAALLVQVSGPGRLDLTGKDVAEATAASHGAGVVKLAVRAKGRARARLNRHGKARVALTVAFAPTEGGPAVSAASSLTLRKAPRHRHARH